MDALHTQRETAEHLVADRRAHYFFAVKGNQPTLRNQLVKLPWAQVPVTHSQTTRGHGREEKRTAKVVTVGTGIKFPHASQAIQITRKKRRIGTTVWATETVHAITDLTADQAPAHHIAGWAREHWAIESMHWIRDVTFGEDHSQIRTGSGPQVMASIRNTAITIIRASGAPNILAALRYNNRDAKRPVKLLLTC